MKRVLAYFSRWVFTDEIPRQSQELRKRQCRVQETIGHYFL